MFAEQLLLCIAIAIDATLYDVFIPCQGRFVLWTQYAEKVARECRNESTRQLKIIHRPFGASMLISPGNQTIPFCVLLHPYLKSNAYE